MSKSAIGGWMFYSGIAMVIISGLFIMLSIGGILVVSLVGFGGIFFFLGGILLGT